MLLYASHTQSSVYPLQCVENALELRVQCDITSHLVVLNIDKALRADDFHSLKEITKVPDFAVLLTNDLDASYEQCADCCC